MNTKSKNLLQEKYFRNITVFLIFLLCNLSYAQKGIIKIQGIVFDDKTNEKLVGANITISDSSVAISNQDGFFSFFIKMGNHLESGKYSVAAKFVGYKKLTKQIWLLRNESEVELFFRLEPEVVRIEQVTISGERFTEDIKYKTYELQQGDLRRIPQFGEADALRAFQALPSVTSVNDFSAQLFLRGGNFDETLIALDDVPVYNPYHLGSFFSMFNTNIIEKQTLYPSNYPNKYGGYLSGALNIQTKPGSYDKTNGSVSIGLISSKAFIETPIGKGSLILAGRRTYFDLIAKLFLKKATDKSGPFPYFFYDVYAKYNYPIDKKNHISLSLLHSRDIFKMFDKISYQSINVKDEPSWGNNLYSVKYTHLFNNRFSINANLYYTSSSFIADGKSINNSSPTETKVNNRIEDISSNINFNYSLVGHNLQAGLELKKLNLNYDWLVGISELSSFGFELEDTFFDYAPNIFSAKNNENFFNIFLRDKIILTKKLDITLGLRNSYLSKLKMNLITPSLNINYQYSNDLELIFNYGKYFQNLFVIKDQNSLLLDPFSVYFLPKNKSQLANSNNINLTLVFTNFLFGSSLELSGYYNKRENLASSYEEDEHYHFEDGYSTGIEILLKKKYGNVSGWLSYSLSRSLKSHLDYYYPSRIDRTNTIKLLFNYKLSESWFFTSFWTYATGLPYTPIVGQYIGGENINLEEHIYDDDFYDLLPIVGAKKSKRTKDYHRLDIGFTGSFIWGALLVKPYFQILNVYNSPNEIGFQESKRSLEDTIRGSIILPTFGITVEF